MGRNHEGFFSFVFPNLCTNVVFVLKLTWAHPYASLLSNTSNKEDSTMSLGNMFHFYCLTILAFGKVFLRFCCSLKALPYVPPFAEREQWFSAFFSGSFSSMEKTIMSSLHFLFSNLVSSSFPPTVCFPTLPPTSLSSS